MIRFENDYTEGAHKRILERLIATNEEQMPGYGKDEYCQNASVYIRKECQAEEAAIHFLVGGTQTNTTMIASILRPHQGAISAVSGHISSNETGAIEATGHKVLPLPSEDGKITATQVKELYDAHWNDASHEHKVQPGLVYISNPTENGTVYRKAELAALSKVCRECNLPLILDGARLGYGLASIDNDLTLADYAKLCDLFYIGGTKIGAMFGEAVVIINESLKKDFRYYMKQRGGLLAKGRMLGIQFETLFEDGLYYEISNHAVEMATILRQAFIDNGFSLRYESTSNQLFPILPAPVITALRKGYSFSFWEEIDATHSAVRFCTSWATKKEHVEMFANDLKQICIKL